MIKFLTIITLVTSLLGCCANTLPQSNVIEESLSYSVLIRDVNPTNHHISLTINKDGIIVEEKASDFGSGTVIVRDGKKGKKLNFVWTAAHVIQPFRLEVKEKNGTNLVSEFRDVGIVTFTYKNEEIVKTNVYLAEVVRYSKDEDLALLKLKKTDVFKKGAEFYLEERAPKIGTPIFHIGSMFGERGYNSYSEGVYAQYDRNRSSHNILDQVTAVIFPGCSGGGVFLKDGRYIGMANAIYAPNVGLIVPSRKIIDWSKRHDIKWAVDPKVAVPSDEDLKCFPVDELDYVKNLKIFDWIDNEGLLSK